MLIKLEKRRSEITISFKYSKDIVEKIKKIKGRKWSPELRAWRLPLNYNVVSNLIEFFGVSKCH